MFMILIFAHNELYSENPICVKKKYMKNKFYYWLKA